MKTNLNNILAIGNGNLIANTRQGATIYKNDLFSETTEKEKKAIRVKLRKKLDNFIISAKQAEKNTEKLNAIRKDWIAYAKNVYNDINIIVDANAKEDKINDVKYFLNLMTEKKINLVKKDNKGNKKEKKTEEIAPAII